MILSTDVWQEGHFIFADGDHGFVKLEMDRLWEHPIILEIILQSLARAEGLPEADVILGVPSGGQRLAEAIVERYISDRPLVKLERVPNGARQDYRFCTEADRLLAQSSKSPRIVEDVVSTLSSIAGVVKLLDPENQDIHSLAVWRRGKVRKIYGVGVTDHYLVEEEVPIYAPEECSYCVR